MSAISKAKKLGLSIAVIFLVGVSSLYMSYRSPGLQVSINNLATLIAGSLGRIVTAQRQDPISAELQNARSLAEAYQKNPNAFSQDAALFETYVNGTLVGSRAFKTRAKLPFLSSQFAGELNQNAMDHWGKPFCVSGDEEVLVILSAGKSGKELSCKRNVPSGELKGIPRKKLIRTDSDYLVLVLDRPTPQP